MNGLKLQFHSVPCSLEMVSVPDGAWAAGVPDDPDDDGPDDGDDGGDEEDEEEQAATAARSAAAPATRRRLIEGALH